MDLCCYECIKLCIIHGRDSLKGNKMDKETVVYEFSYFLDAWLYCTQNGLDWKTSIHKKDFRTWMVMV